MEVKKYTKKSLSFWLDDWQRSKHVSGGVSSSSVSSTNIRKNESKVSQFNNQKMLIIALIDQKIDLDSVKMKNINQQKKIYWKRHTFSSDCFAKSFI